MSKTTSFLLIACFSLSIMLIFILNIISEAVYKNKSWGFIRLLPPHIILSGKTLDLKYNSYYVCGMTSNNIYLANYTTPGLLLVSNYNLTDTHTIKLSLPFDKNITLNGVTVSVDSPHVYLIDRITASFVYGKLGNNYSFYSKVDSFQFSSSRPISPSKIVIRTYSKQLKQNILSLKTINNTFALPKTFVPKKQLDGIYSVDGMLRYNYNSNHLIYLYYYRNEFLVFDSSLNLLYKGQTIDTITTAKIKVSQLSSEKITAFSSPPLFVNRLSCVSQDWLFVNSGLMANNEENAIFQEQSVIDVYSLIDGKSRLSFYLPKYKKNRIRSFSVFNKNLIAQYDHYLVTFKLNF